MTTDNLRKRAILIMDWCSMCKCNGESVDYLLHCPLARELWDILFCLVGITWVMPYSVIALLESWRGFIGTRRSRDVWGAAPACLM